MYSRYTRVFASLLNPKETLLSTMFMIPVEEEIYISVKAQSRQKGLWPMLLNTVQIWSKTKKMKQVQTRWGTFQLYVLNAYMVRGAYHVNYTALASLTCQMSRRKEVGGRLIQCKNIKKSHICQFAHHLHIWPLAYCHMTVTAQINQFLNVDSPNSYAGYINGCN